MARSRNIKPGFFVNEDLVELGFATRLLFAGLWTLADREGRLEDRPKKIKIGVFPADDVNVDEMLQELHDAKFVERYEVNSEKYVQISNWSKHQNPHHTEKASEIPDANGALTVKQPVKNQKPQEQDGGNLADSGFLIPDSLIPDSLKDDSAAAIPAKAGKPSRSSSTAAKPDGVDDQVWRDFQAIRKAKRAPLTDTAMEGIRREADKAGLSLGEAIAYCCEAGWQGFNAGWYADRTKGAVVGGRVLPNKQEALEARNRAVGDAWAAEMRAKMQGVPA